MTTSITHIAGMDITIGGRRLRQRCAWCGAVLLDYDLTRVAVAVEPGQEDEPAKMATYESGRLVRVTGDSPRVFELLDETGKLPDDACGNVHDEVTGG